MRPPLPKNEISRLVALGRSGLIDGDPDPELQQIASLAAQLCGAPMAAVSLVQAVRQWFRVRVGLEAEETPRPISFCGHAILMPDGLVVPDATKDPRFAQNPLVTGPMGLRFYASAPIRLASGEALGTVCVLDTRPRGLTEAEHQALRLLARQVAVQAELRIERAELATANEALAERTASLALANQELETFAQTLSHDLRAPLRIIRGYAGVLLDDHGEALGAQGRAHLARIESVAARGSRLVDGLLAMCRVTSAELRLVDVDVSALAREIVEELRLGSPSRRVRVEVAPDLHVRGDETLVRAAMENLLGNAWKFSAVRDEAHVEVGRTPGGELFVRDDGSGFDAAGATNLFQSFQTFHGLEVEGAGVGLATVRRIVERHGGHVRAESSPGRGATFYLDFGAPLAPPDLPVAFPEPVPV